MANSSAAMPGMWDAPPALRTRAAFHRCAARVSSTPPTRHTAPRGERVRAANVSNPKAAASTTPTAGSHPISLAVARGSARATRTSSAASSASRRATDSPRRLAASGAPTVVATRHAAATSPHAAARSDAPGSRRPCGGPAADEAIAVARSPPSATAAMTRNAAMSPVAASISHERAGLTPACSMTASRSTVPAGSARSGSARRRIRRAATSVPPREDDPTPRGSAGRRPRCAGRRRRIGRRGSRDGPR